MSTQNWDENEHGFRAWVRRHKKGLIIGGCIVVTVVGGYVVFKNWDDIVSFVTRKESQALSDVIDPVLPPVEKAVAITPPDALTLLNNGEAFDVNQHIRNLPNGYKASAAKLASATERGIHLGDNQTWVKAYTKNSAA